MTGFTEYRAWKRWDEGSFGRHDIVDGCYFAAELAKAGVDMASGSPLMVMTATAMKEREESQSIDRAAQMKAEQQRYYGRMAAYTGKVGAMTSFLTGLGRTSTQLYDYMKTNSAGSSED